jgi:hypothetical protein
LAISNITIYSGTESIVMPQVRYTLSAEEESDETTMMSGRIVKDILGYRTVIDAEWDWVPASDLAKLISLIRSGSFLETEYQDVDGQTKKENFKFSQPEPEVFTFQKDGTAVWHTVKLKMTAQEVKKDA